MTGFYSLNLADKILELHFEAHLMLNLSEPLGNYSAISYQDLPYVSHFVDIKKPNRNLIINRTKVNS